MLKTIQISHNSVYADWERQIQCLIKVWSGSCHPPEFGERYMRPKSRPKFGRAPQTKNLGQFFLVSGRLVPCVKTVKNGPENWPLIFAPPRASSLRPPRTAMGCASGPHQGPWTLPWGCASEPLSLAIQAALKLAMGCALEPPSCHGQRPRFLNAVMGCAA